MKTTIKEIFNTRFENMEYITRNNGYCCLVFLRTNKGRKAVSITGYNMNYIMEFVLRLRWVGKVGKSKRGYRQLPNAERLEFYKQIREQMQRMDFGSTRF